MKIYSVRDVNVGFNQPFCDVNDDAAIRGFAYAVNNSDIMAFTPKDFDLYRIGEFQNDTGMIESCLPELVIHGTEVFQN